MNVLQLLRELLAILSILTPNTNDYADQVDTIVNFVAAQIEDDDKLYLICTPNMSGKLEAYEYYKPRFIGTLRQCLSITPREAEIVYDVNTGEWLYYEENYCWVKN